MAQASRAPSRQADIFHNRKRRRAPLNSCTSSSILPGGESDGHKALAILCIACRARSCICDSSCSRSPEDPDISSSGRPVSIPTDITLSVPFLAELHGGKFEHILNMPPRSLLFSFTESASWARTSFNSSPSWVLASWSLLFFCMTRVSTRSPAAACLCASCSPSCGIPGFCSGLSEDFGHQILLALLVYKHNIVFSQFGNTYQSMPLRILTAWP